MADYSDLYQFGRTPDCPWPVYSSHHLWFLALTHFGWRLSATARDVKAQYSDIRWQDGTLTLLNIVTVAYGLPTLMLFVALRYWPDWLPKQLKPLGWQLFSVLGMVFITMTVRQLWHGDLLKQHQIYVGEQYCYSLAWMLTAIGLMTLGITKQHLLLRFAVPH